MSAATSAATLTVEATRANIVGMDDLYSFGPDGTTFDPPAEITITLAPTSKIDVVTAWLGTRQSSTGRWERLEILGYDVAARSIRARVHHFSDFAVFSGLNMVAGRGDRFDVGGVGIETSTQVDLAAVAIPEYVHLALRGGASDVSFTFTGLLPSQTYLIYRDTHADEPLTAHSDFEGRVAFAIGATGPYDLFMRTTHGTVLLPRDCALWGTPILESGTAVGCTLNRPITDNVEITATFCATTPIGNLCPPVSVRNTPSNYVLDCAGHGVVGHLGLGVSTGVLLGAPASSIRRCTISNFPFGVEFTFGTNGIGGSIDHVTIADVRLAGVSSLGHHNFAIADSTIAAPSDPTANNTSIANVAAGEVFGWHLTRNSIFGRVVFLSHLRDSSITSSDQLHSLGIQPEPAEEGFSSVLIYNNTFAAPGGNPAIGVVGPTASSLVIAHNTIDTLARKGIVIAKIGSVSLENENRIGGAGAGQTGIELSDAGPVELQFDRTHVVGNSVGLEFRGNTAPKITLFSYNDIYANGVDVIAPFEIALTGPQGNFWGVRCVQPSGFYGPSSVLGGPVQDAGAFGLDVAVDIPGRPPAAQIRARGFPGCQLLDTDGDGATPDGGDCDDTITACAPSTCADNDSDGIPRCKDCNDTNPRCGVTCPGLTARHLFQLTGP
ncbi:MAG: hypothetical protein IT381_33225 [Deltaproteobacteria bacterium]|nr:hypothetical protein [Deltaproteobacteria bacterium]